MTQKLFNIFMALLTFLRTIFRGVLADWGFFQNPFRCGLKLLTWSAIAGFWQWTRLLKPSLLIFGNESVAECSIADFWQWARLLSTPLLVFGNESVYWVLHCGFSAMNLFAQAAIAVFRQWTRLLNTPLQFFGNEPVCSARHCRISAMNLVAQHAIVDFLQWTPLLSTSLQFLSNELICFFSISCQWQILLYHHMLCQTKYLLSLFLK